MSTPSTADRLLDAVDSREEDVIRLLQQLIRAEPVNPPGNEDRAAAVLRPHLAELGFEVEEFTEVEGRPNLVARLPGGDGPTLLSTAHLDVVPVADRDAWPVDPFAAEIVDGRLYGRGACDHKSPIAAMLYAVRALDAADVTLGGDLLFVFDSNEERGGEHGMEYVVKQTDIDADMGIYACTTGLTADAAAYFEKQGRYNIYRSNFGNQVYEVTVQGDPVHPMAPQETVSAGDRLSHVLPVLRDYCQAISTREADLVDRLAANITTIDSDGWNARASPEMRVYVHRYYTATEDADAVYEEFREYLHDGLAASGLDAEQAVAIDRVQDMRPIEVAADHPLVTATTAAAERVKGVTPTVTGVPAQTGITWMVEQFGIPMILFGFGNVDLHHSDPEWIDPQDVVDTAKAYALTYHDLLGTADSVSLPG